MKKFLILGDGIVSHLVANVLSNFGHKSFILKPKGAKKLSKSNRYFSLNILSKYFLSLMEFWPLDKNIIPYSKIKTWDNETHKKLNFDSHDISFDNFGFVVNESELIDKIITKSKKNKNISYLNNIEEESRDGIIRILDQKKITDIDYIISTIKNHDLVLNRIKFDEINYNQEALVTNVKLENSDNHTAYQKFSKSCIYGLLPLGNSNYNLIISADFDKINDLKSQNKTKFLNTIRHDLQNDLFSVNKVFSHTSFPLSGYKARQHYVDNILVMGGAAHSIHPLAGMGLNMGIQEAFILYELLQRADGHMDDKLLISCDYEFRKFNNEIYYAVNFLKEFYTNKTFPNHIKKISLEIFDNLEFIKTKVIMKASGASTLKSFNLIR